MDILPRSRLNRTSEIGYNEEKRAPNITGELEFRNLTDRSIGLVNEGLRQMQSGMDRTHPMIDYSDRSAISQLGIDTIPDWPSASVRNNRLIIPVELLSYKDRSLLSMIRGMKRLEMGRLLLFAGTHPLTEQEVRRAQEERMVDLPKGATTEPTSGVILTPLDPVQYNMRMTGRKDRQYALVHGRRALIKLQEKMPTPLRTIKGNTFVVSDILVSTGPYAAVIQRAVNDSIEHMGAVLLDPERSTGMRRGRQVELMNHGSEVPIDQIRIPLRLYNSQPVTTRNFQSFSLPTRKRIHVEGMKCIDTLDERLLPYLFEDIETNPNERDRNAAIVVSVDGITRVPPEPVYNWHKDAITDAARDGKRTTDPRFAEVTTMLKMRTAENGRLLITHYLPSASHLETLSREGVKTFLFRCMHMPRSIFEGKADPRPENNFYMDATTHKKLIELERQGCEFLWWPRSKHGDEPLRIFYKNFFTRPDCRDSIDDFRKSGTGISMFGASVNGLEHIQDSINAFGDGLQELSHRFGQFAILEGGGPSLMQMARQMARDKGFINMSFGMDFEQVGEVPDFGPDAVIFFSNDQIEYRQQFFEYMNTIGVFSIGGKGTGFEFKLNFLKMGLGSSVARPIYLVDPRKGVLEHFYKGFCDQIDAMTDDQAFEKPLCQRWMRNLLQPMRSYEQVLDHMRKFMESPSRFWNDAGIPKEHQRSAFMSHRALCEQTQYHLPAYLLQAGKEIGIQDNA